METETEAGGYQRESKAEARTRTRAHTQSHIQECTAKEANGETPGVAASPGGGV